jgi:hypothetical protein
MRPPRYPGFPIFGVLNTRIEKNLHVPKGTKARYKSTTIWKDFATIVEISE